MQQPDKIKTKIDFKSAAFKKYFANTSWLFAEKIFRVLLGAVVVISITNYLGAKNFGLYSYAISFAGIFSVIASLGIDSILTRELVKNPENKKALLGTGFVIRLTGAFVSFLLTVIAVYLFSSDSFTSILILIIALSAFFQSFYIIEFFFQSQVLSKYPVIVKSVSFFLASGIKLLLIIFNSTLIWFIIFTAAEFLFLAIGLVLIYLKSDPDIFKWKYEKTLAKILIKDSWPLILSGIVIAVYMYIDQIMITNMLGETENGHYATAVKLSEAWYFIPMVITTSLFPAIVSAKNTDEDLYISRLQKLYDLLAWSAIAIAIPVTFFSGTIIDILYKPEFAPAAQVLTIYIWAGVAVFLGVASSQYLITENLTKLSFYRTFIGMAANVILNIILIPIWGITGSALATLISYSIAVFSIGIGKRTFPQLKMMIKSILFINLFKFGFKYVRSFK